MHHKIYNPVEDQRQHGRPQVAGSLHFSAEHHHIDLRGLYDKCSQQPPRTQPKQGSHPVSYTHLAFPDMIFTTHRSSYDYIYSREALAKLAGKKYHGKRNHIARFKDNDWHYEPMTPDNLSVCLEMHREWERQQRQYMNDSMMEDNRGTLRAFRDFEALGLEGGLLYQGSRLVAYTMGEPLTTDTYAVHFEKAFPDVNGAYPAINQEFVLHNMEAYQYINREEDTGDEGLRKAKLSYHPVIILQEYEATLEEE